MRGVAGLLLALAAVGCGPPEAAPTRPLSLLPDEAGPLDALNRRHARLRQRMRHRGYGEEVGLTRAFVLEDRGVSFPLDLGVGKCSTFLALGGGSIRDLTLTLHDGQGDVAATESIDGEGGLVHVCPQGEGDAMVRPHHLVIRAREGAGAVMVAHFRSEPEVGDGFDGLFEGVLAPRVPFRDVEEHLARSRSALRARGFSPVGAPLLERVTEGSVVRLPVMLEPGRCYVATGRSGEGLRDIDLFLFDAAGVEVARDLAQDAEPSIEHCPSEAGRHTVELRAFEGAGAVGVMVAVGPAEEPEAAPGEPAPEPHDERVDDPALALGVMAAPLQNRGFAPPLFVSRDAAIVPGEVRTHDVVIGPGCALIAGAASHEGMDLDLYLADDAGREVDRDTAVQSTARVRACRDQPSVMRVAVKGYGRDGAYALALLRAPDSVTSIQALRVEEATAPYRLRGYTPRFVLNAELRQESPFRRTVVLEAGECLAVAAAGDEEAEDLDLFLRATDGALVVSDSGPDPYATLSRCAEAREVLSLELHHHGRGRFALHVLGTGEGAGRTEATGAESSPAPGPPPPAPSRRDPSTPGDPPPE